MSNNPVIQNRNSYNLGLGNHIDKDADLDAQYALLRNVALTGSMVNGKFVSKYSKHFSWLIECAVKGCPTCNGIFENAKNKNYNIRPFYMNNVVSIETKQSNVPEKTFAKQQTNKQPDPDKHPLYDLVVQTFTKRR
tara:strand:+ start:16107 stop:16514 length:408 start_codon:yes stop_codon:yes gene_type:complete